MKKSTSVTKALQRSRTAQANLAARLATMVGAEPPKDDGRGGDYASLPYTHSTNGCFGVTSNGIWLDMKLTLQQGEAALRAIGRAYPPNADQEGLERLRLHVERQVRKLIVTGKSIESDLGMAVFNIAIAQRQGTLVSTAIDKLLAKVWKAARR